VKVEYIRAQHSVNSTKHLHTVTSTSAYKTEVTNVHVAHGLKL